MDKTNVPDILQCMAFKGSSVGKSSRYVKDYEIDIYLGGQRDMYIDGTRYKITEGSTVFRKPGQLVESYGDYNCYMLTLDFSKEINISQEKYMRHRTGDAQSICQDNILEDIPPVFYPYHKDELVAIIKKIESVSYPNIEHSDLAKQYVFEFLLLLIADAVRHAREPLERSVAAKDYIKTACSYIKGNYNKEISVSHLAEMLNLNPNYMIRLFKNNLGITPGKYITELRLFYAKNMLLETDLSTKEIAFQCGFNSPAYFTKCFKAKYKKPPEQYRNFKY